MRVSRYIIALLALATSTTSLLAQGADSQLVRLRARDSTWQAASAARDVERMMEHYAPGATADFGGAPTRGAPAIREMWRRNYADSTYRLTWTMGRAELMTDTDLAYTIGRWRLRDGARAQEGTYFAVWQRQPDGQWRVLIDTAR